MSALPKPLAKPLPAAARLLTRAWVERVAVTRDGDALDVWSAAELPPDLLDGLRRAKAEVLALLADPNRCRLCGEPVDWSRPGGLCFADGSAAHLTCADRAEVAMSSSSASVWTCSHRSPAVLPAAVLPDDRPAPARASCQGQQGLHDGPSAAGDDAPPDYHFRGDAAFAKPELHERLDTEGIGYAIRLPGNPVLQARIGHLLPRPVGRPRRGRWCSTPASAAEPKAGPSRARSRPRRRRWLQNGMEPSPCKGTEYLTQCHPRGDQGSYDCTFLCIEEKSSKS